MAEYNPDDLIGKKSYYLPSKKENDIEHLSNRKVIEISQKLDEDQEALTEQISIFCKMWVRQDHRPSSHTTKC